MAPIMLRHDIQATAAFERNNGQGEEWKMREYIAQG